MARKIDLNSEREFENQKVTGGISRSRQARFYWATKLESHKFDLKMRDFVKGKKVLEIGCSTGQHAELLGPLSKNYVGIDISDQAISLAKQKNIPNCDFHVVDGHSIDIEKESFDIVFASGVLHHLDLEVALPEISRLLKSDGVLAFDEPLGLNPLFGLYRLLTPGARTIDETPFGILQIRQLKKHFALNDVNHFGLLSVLSGLKGFSKFRRPLTRIDSLISASPLKWLMWRFSGFAEKLPTTNN